MNFFFLENMTYFLDIQENSRIFDIFSEMSRKKSGRSFKFQEEIEVAHKFAQTTFNGVVTAHGEPHLYQNHPYLLKCLTHRLARFPLFQGDNQLVRIRASVN